MPDESLPDDVIQALIAQHPTSLTSPPEPKQFTRQIRRATQYPSFNSKHVRVSDTQKSCASRGCRTPTYLRFDGIPYCTTHLINQLIFLIDALESKL